MFLVASKHDDPITSNSKFKGLKNHLFLVDLVWPFMDCSRRQLATRTIDLTMA